MITNFLTPKGRCVRSLIVIVLSFFVVSLANAFSLPPRFYEKTLLGVNVIPVLGLKVDGNVNPLDPTYAVNSNADISANIALAGFSKSFPLFDRAAQLAYLQPMGDISIDNRQDAPVAFNSSANGYGDPFFEFSFNVFGPPALKTLPEAIRYQPGFSMDLLLDLSVPLGDYEKGESVNMGTNRFWGRVGLPVVYQIGDVWAPGHRTSLELLPAVIWYGDNDDYGPSGNLTQSTDPGYSIAAHLTHDVSDEVWVSLDYTYIQLGDSDVGPVKQDGKDFASFGATIGTQLTRNLNATLGYQSTINDDGEFDVKMSTFSFSLVFFWAPILDGLHRVGFDD